MLSRDGEPVGGVEGVSDESGESTALSGLLLDML